jgi:predicted O-methyltransferase YrrM
MGQAFNLILVDGDHTQEGAEADLRDCFRLLEPGGALIFDDAVPELLEVWRDVTRALGVMTWEYLDDTPPYCSAIANY